MNKKIRILNIILSLILIGIVVVHFLFEVPALHFSQPIIEESGLAAGLAIESAVRFRLCQTGHSKRKTLLD